MTAQVRRVHSVKKRKLRRDSNSCLLPRGTNTAKRACHIPVDPVSSGGARCLLMMMAFAVPHQMCYKRFVGTILFRHGDINHENEGIICFRLKIIQLVLWISFLYRLPWLFFVHTYQHLRFIVRNRQSLGKE